MKKRLTPFLIPSLLLCLVLSLLAMPAIAEEAATAAEAAPGADMMAMMAAWQKAATPGEQHASLAKQVGTWKATVTAWNAPGAEPMVSEGTFQRTLTLGGRVIDETYDSEIMGMPFNGHSLLGYDNVTGRWWTIWVDNMSTGPMVMWGEWDEKEKALVYAGKTPDPMSGQLIDMKTIVRHLSDDEEVVEMYDMRSGSPVKTMEIAATRQ